MNGKTIFLVVCFVATLAFVNCSSCEYPQVTSKTFTTLDATIVANIAYVSEFEVKCDSGTPSNLYADLNGVIVPVSVTGTNKYQVSWTEDTKSARSGNIIVRIFDEDGNAALRKAQRDGDDINTVKALFDITINHPGAFYGPWLKSEFVAVAVALVIAYVAVSSRSKLVS